jgi:hypothetical protein
LGAAAPGLTSNLLLAAKGAIENPTERHLSKVCVAALGDRERGAYLAAAIRQAKSKSKTKFDQGYRVALGMVTTRFANAFAAVFERLDLIDKNIVKLKAEVAAVTGRVDVVEGVVHDLQHTTASGSGGIVVRLFPSVVHATLP